jgi:hypothetical protein
MVLEPNSRPTGLYWSRASWACLLDDQPGGWIAGIVIQKSEMPDIEDLDPQIV